MVELAPNNNRVFSTTNIGAIQVPDEVIQQKHSELNICPTFAWPFSRDDARPCIQLLELEQPQLHKHLPGGVFTESGWEQVCSEVPACSSIQERIHELAMILAEARLVADVVEFTCPAKTNRKGSATGRAGQACEARARGSPLSVSLR